MIILQNPNQTWCDYSNQQYITNANSHEMLAMMKIN